MAVATSGQRDWVINAQHQYALRRVPLRATGRRPDAEPDAQPIATGFQRNNMNARGRHDRPRTHELQRRPRQNIRRSRPRPHTGCCQCHNHKFDLITQPRLLPDVRVLHRERRRPRRRPRHQPHPSLSADCAGNGRRTGTPRANPSTQEEAANPHTGHARWENEQRLRLSAEERSQTATSRPHQISTPNTGKGFDIEPPNFVRIASPSFLIAYDV